MNQLRQQAKKSVGIEPAAANDGVDMLEQAGRGAK